MTKEELFDSFSRYHVFSDDEVYKRLEKFFSSNVVIPKGEDRHHYAEPVYEYKVVMTYSDGTYELTEKYFTEEEYGEFGFPKTCTTDDTTKRIRK